MFIYVKELWERTVSELELEGVDLTGSKTTSTERGNAQQFKKMSFTELFKEG